MKRTVCLFPLLIVLGLILSCDSENRPVNGGGETVSVEQIWDEWEAMPALARDGFDISSLVWGGPGLGGFLLEGEAPLTAEGEDWGMREGPLAVWEIPARTKTGAEPAADSAAAASKWAMNEGNLGPAVGLPACSVDITGSTVTVTGPTKTFGQAGFVQGTKLYTFKDFKDGQGRSLETAVQALLAAPAPQVGPDQTALRCADNPKAVVHDGPLLAVADDAAKQILKRLNGLKKEDMTGSSIHSSHLRVENIAVTCCEKGVLRQRVGGDVTIIDGTWNEEEGKWEGTWTTCSWTRPAKDCADDCAKDECREGLCADGADNDADGPADCADTDCAAASCGEGCECRDGNRFELRCADGFDNDGDGLFDCQDPDCADQPCGDGCVCGQAEICTDGKDNDGDGQTDCADPDCAGAACGDGCLCQGGQASEQNCGDGIDNDGDLAADCLDGADCNGKACAEGKICGGGECKGEEPVLLPPWSQVLGGAEQDSGQDVALGESSVYMIGGMNLGSFENPDYYMLLARYDLGGNQLWTRTLPVPNGAGGRRITVDENENAYVVGYCSGGLAGVPGIGADDAFILKYDKDGTLLWTKILGSAAGDRAQGVSLDPDGNLFVAGETAGSFDGEVNAGLSDGFVAKYSPDGTRVWTRFIGSPNNDHAFSAAADNAGNVFVAGTTAGDLHGIPRAGSFDVFVSKYGPDGTRLWTRLVGGESAEYSQAVAADQAGNVYVAGHTSGELLGHPLTGGNVDFFLISYDPGGEMRWAEVTGGFGSEIPWDLAVSDGYVYPAGSSTGDFMGCAHWNPGELAIFVSKYSLDGQWERTILYDATNDRAAYGAAADRWGNLFLTGITSDGFGGQPGLGRGDIFLMCEGPM